MTFPDIGTLRTALASGETTSVALLAEALARIADHRSEGARAFTAVYGLAALEAARTADKQRAEGADLPLLGIPVSVKDLFDIAGEVTTAGSVVLAGEPPAARSAAIVSRLQAAGAVIVGRTNMTEFAFSGLGLNPHYGTPRNPWDRATGRIPGGSSSGAAVSVADGMCAAAIGSDTGGSVRIPSALCGLTGFKPTQAAVPLDGCYPLSPTLDSIGPLARSTADCALLYAVLSGTPVPTAQPPRALRLLVPENLVHDGIAPEVAADFSAALDRLSAGGHELVRNHFAPFDRIAELNRIGAFPGLEAYAAQKERLAHRYADFDPRVSGRIAAAAALPPDAADRLHALRAVYIAEFRAALEGFDALVMPTVPLTAPAIADLADDDAYSRINLMMLRNPTTVNLADGCALTLPIQAPGSAPTGLTLAGPAGADHHILACGAMLEPLARLDGKEGLE